MGEWSDREGWGCRTKTGREAGSGVERQEVVGVRMERLWGKQVFMETRIGRVFTLDTSSGWDSVIVIIPGMSQCGWCSLVSKKERARDDQSKKRVMSLSMSTKLPILPFPLMLVVTMSLYFPFAAPDRHLKKREECGNNHEYEDQASTQQPISCGR